MTLEELEKKVNALRRDVADYHGLVMGRYYALDARLDSKLGDLRKSKWTPICVALYTMRRCCGRAWRLNGGCRHEARFQCRSGCGRLVCHAVHLPLVAQPHIAPGG